jgi:hypothetical protein
MFNNLKNLYSHEKKNRTEHEVQVSSLQFTLETFFAAKNTQGVQNIRGVGP